MADEPVDLARAARFRLGHLEVDPPRRRVSTGETLEPRVMQVLVALARADGAVVSRDELIRTCWDGRIVGEDAITRVIGALRRLAKERGGGAFRIETVPKVGYRLVGDVRLVVAPEPPVAAQPAPIAAPVKPGVPVPGWRRPAPLVATAIAVFAAALLLVWADHRGGGGSAVAVQFAGYKRLSPAVPAALPEAIADATRSAFTEDGRVAVTTGSGDFRLGGSLDRSGDITRVALRVDDTRTGVTLWARVVVVPPVEAAHIATRTAGTTVQLARCALSQQAIHGKPLSDAVLTLLFAECAAEMSAATHRRALDLAREITEAAPDLASGWASRAFVANGNSFEVPPAAAAPLKAEARMAMAKALTLDPKDSRAWHVKVYMVDPTDLAAIDRAFHAALNARPSECGCVYDDYGGFLVGVGRAKEALAMFQRARDTMPLHGAPLAGIGRIEAGAGRIAEAQRTFADLEALAPTQLVAGQVIVSNALWTRDHAGALRQLAILPPSGPPALKNAIEGGFRSLASGDPAAKRAAAAELLRQNALCHCNGIFNLRLVAALGDTAGAFAGLRALVDERPSNLREALAWDPVFAAMRREPDYPDLARRLGLVAYWRSVKIRPDFCAEANAPPVCATI